MGDDGWKYIVAIGASMAAISLAVGMATARDGKEETEKFKACVAAGGDWILVHERRELFECRMKE